MNAEWKPVRSMHGGRGTQFGSIGRDGRLTIPTVVATAANLKPGYVELFTRVGSDGLEIAIKPRETESAWCVKATTTGSVKDWGKRGEDGRVCNLLVPLKSALAEHAFVIAKRQRVAIGYDSIENAIVVQMGHPTLVSDHVVAVTA